MENLTLETFKEKVFDYENNQEWNYKGSKPAILDFYASWCNPCKMLSPILEDLQKENPNIIIYKINTEEQPQLSALFNIRNIPALLFVPLSGQPQMATGLVPKENIQKAIDEVLK